MSTWNGYIRFSLTIVNSIFSLLIGWVLDLLFGDPARLPHPIVWFGRAIAACEHRLNKGSHRKLKGGITAVMLIVLVFALTASLRTLF